MYLSDEFLVYANGVDAACYVNPDHCFFDRVGTSGLSGTPTTRWIYNSYNLEEQHWFLSPRSSNSDKVFIAGYGINLRNDWASTNLVETRPVLYLLSNVKIIDGTGEQNNPYWLGL
ncbi:MAG: hypothetical protein IJR82_01330 [Bacilli bacterium]|nr:hypothetical protein [Bacilli bacterium]